MALAPMPLGMVTHGHGGGPVGIGISVPMMTPSHLVSSMPPQPKKLLVSPDSSQDAKDLCKLLNSHHQQHHHPHHHHHRTPSPHSPHSTMGGLGGNVNGGGLTGPSSNGPPVNPLAWTNQILQPISGMGYPVIGMSMMGPPPPHHHHHHALLSGDSGMLYGILSGAGSGSRQQQGASSELSLPSNPNLTNLSINLANVSSSLHPPQPQQAVVVAAPSPSILPLPHHPPPAPVISNNPNNIPLLTPTQQQQSPTCSSTSTTLLTAAPISSASPNTMGHSGGSVVAVAGAVGVGAGLFGESAGGSSGSSTCSNSSLSPGCNNPGAGGVAAVAVYVGPPKEIIHCKSCTLFPPNPAAPPPTTRDKPPGCRTVFVGGLPENVTDEIIREIFDRCGEITTVRMSKKNFCHIRFELESFVEKAIFLSGYRIRIGSNSDAANIGRLHVDYAQARDDLYEWECRERKLLRERRHRERIEQERLLPPSPPPVVHYSEHEAVNVAEKLKVDESFIKAVQVLITWLERGDCTKRNSSAFYTMIQSTNSHVRRLLAEKSQYDEELQRARDLMRQRMQGLLMQFSQIEKVFHAAVHKKAWDHFTKAQRKNIDIWKKQAGEIKNMQLEEALNERTDEEMELSDSDSDEGQTENCEFPLGKRRRMDDDNHKTVNHLKEENDSLRCQLEAFKNEVDLIKADLKTEVELKDQQIQQLQKELLEGKGSQFGSCSGGEKSNGIILGLDEAGDGLRKEFNKNIQDSSSSPASSPSRMVNDVAGTGSTKSYNTESSSDFCDSSSSSISSIQSSQNHSLAENHICDIMSLPSPGDGVKITEFEARLIGIISTFLHVHPFGASLDYIWSYAQKVLPAVRANQLENLMFKFPNLFRQETTGIGATLERKWIFVGFS